MGEPFPSQGAKEAHVIIIILQTHIYIGMSIRRVLHALTLLYVDDNDTLYSVTGYYNALHVVVCKRSGEDMHRVFGNIDEMRNWNEELAALVGEDTGSG